MALIQQTIMRNDHKKKEVCMVTLYYDRPSKRYSISFDAIVIDHLLPFSQNAFVVLSTHIRQLSHIHSTQ